MGKAIRYLSWSLSQPLSWWVNLYVSALTLCILGVAYLDLANYYSIVTDQAFLPKYAYFALGAGLVPLVVARIRLFLDYLNHPLTWLILLLSLLNLLNMLVYASNGNDAAFALTWTRIQYLVLAIMLGFAVVQARPLLIGTIVIALTIILTGLQVTDFLIPGMLVPPGTEGVVLGRAGSTLINANKAAESLILLALLSLPFLSSSWRIWLMLFIFSGILLSFSRAGLVMWLLVIIMGLWVKVFPRRACWILLAFLSILVSAAVHLMGFLLSNADASGQDNLYTRLMFFSTLDVSDYSANERIAVSLYALDAFLDQPILGNGSGFTHLWDVADAAPHNQHLLMLAEYGLIGYLMFAGMLVLIFRGRGFFRTINLPQMIYPTFVAVIAFSLFTHNMLDNLYWLLTFVLLSQSQFRYKA